MKKIYLLGILLSLFFACNIKEQSEVQKEVLASTEVIEINADDLLKSFVKDSTAAAEKYVGKVLSIKGHVGFFEQIDTLTGHVNDSLPAPLKWLANRVINDLQSGNIFFKEIGVASPKPSYNVQATFPKEYRKELVGIKEKSKVTVKGKLEHIMTLSQVLPDSSKRTLLYTLSLQGCVLEKKK